MNTSLQRPLPIIFVAFLGPMLLSNFLQSFSTTLNNIFIGQLLGVEAMAAVSSFFPIIFFFISLVIGLGAGASVLIGQAWGAKDLIKVKVVIGSFLTVNFIMGCFFALLGWFFVDDLLYALNTPAMIFADAHLYAKFMMLGLPMIFVFMSMTFMLRGLGDSLTPLLALLINTLCGFIVTPMLILGWLGLPQLGVASPAIAGLFGNTVSFVWLVFFWQKKRHPWLFDHEFRSFLRIDWEITKTGLKIALPTSIQMMTIALSELVLLGLINQHGATATASMGAVNQIFAYVQFPALSIAITVSVLAAHAIGQGNLDLLKRITRMGIYFNLGLTGTLVLLAYLLSEWVIGLFIIDPSVIEVAQTLLHHSLWGFVIFGIARVLSATMQASGDVNIPTAINIVCIALVEVPFAWWINQRFGLVGIWWSYPLVFSCMLLGQFVYYHYFWRHKTIVRLI